MNYLEIHYRSLELCKTQTLSGSLNYDKTLSLSFQARSDLQWVIVNITHCNSSIHIRGRETRQTGNPSDEFPVLV